MQRRGDGRPRTLEQGFQRAPSISSQVQRYDTNHIKFRIQEEGAEALTEKPARSCCSRCKMVTVSLTGRFSVSLLHPALSTSTVSLSSCTPSTPLPPPALPSAIHFSQSVFSLTLSLLVLASSRRTVGGCGCLSEKKPPQLSCCRCLSYLSCLSLLIPDFLSSSFFLSLLPAAVAVEVEEEKRKGKLAA